MICEPANRALQLRATVTGARWLGCCQHQPRSRLDRNRVLQDTPTCDGTRRDGPPAALNRRVMVRARERHISWSHTTVAVFHSDTGKPSCYGGSVQPIYSQTGKLWRYEAESTVVGNLINLVLEDVAEPGVTYQDDRGTSYKRRAVGWIPAPPPGHRRENIGGARDGIAPLSAALNPTGDINVTTVVRALFGQPQSTVPCQVRVCLRWQHTVGALLGTPGI